MDDTDDADTISETVENNGELPALDFGRLEPPDEEVPLHHQPKHKSQQTLLHYGGRASPAPTANKRLHKLKLARLSHLDDGTKAKVSRSVQTSHVKSWLHVHGYVVKADKLHPAVARVIEEWFQLVDQDGSRTLEHHELMTALKAAQIPCSDATITEMINLMDMNKDGVIGWEEFEVFMTEEFAAGKSLLSGEYLLPSGTSLNFGVMIGKLKRNKLLRDIMEDPGKRNRWASIASSPDALGRELAMMQEAVDATGLTLEHLKRSKGAGVVGNTPQAQLTAALVRAMDDSRRAARAAEPVRNLMEKLRTGVLTPGPELSRRDSAAAPPPPPEQQSFPFPSPVRTARGRTCPDPTAAAPLTATTSEGGLSACSSIDTHMRLHLHLSAPLPGGGGGSDEKDATTAAAGSALSYNASAVARYLASQQSCYPTPPPLLTQAGSVPLECWAGQGPRAAAATQYHGSGASAPHAQTVALPAPPAAVYGGLRRPSDAPSVGAVPARPPGSPRSPAPWSEPLPTANSSRRGSASRLFAARGGGGAAQRDRSPSPSPLPSGHGGCQHQQQPAPEPHYLAAGTVSSRAHAGKSTRVMSQVGLMARELRVAPGRFSAEPLGLPAAVLAATRGQWGVHDGGGRAGTDRAVSASADGFVASSRSTTVYGGSAATAATPPQLHRRSGSPLVDARPDTTPAAVAPRSSSSTLPVLPHTGQLSLHPDSSLLSRKVERAGAAAAPNSAGSTGRSAEVGRGPASSLPDASLLAPMRLLAAAAWEAPASPREQGGGGSTAFSFSPRASWPVNYHSPAAAAAGPAAAAAGPAPAATPAVQLVPQAAGGSAADAGAGAAAGKALQPTPAGMRSRAAAYPSNAECGGSSTSSRRESSSATRRRAGSGGDGGAEGQPAALLDPAATPVASVKIGGGGPDVLAAPVPPELSTADSWLLSSDGGGSQYSGGCGVAGGRRSPPRCASPPGGGGTARASGRPRAQAAESGDGGAAATVSLHRRDAAAALSAALLDSLPLLGSAGAQPWLSGQQPCGVTSGGAVSAPVSALDSARSLPAAAGSSSSGGRATGGGRGAVGGSPGRAALALIGPREAGRPPSRARASVGARGDKEDATHDPSWQAAAASLLQLRITQQLSDLEG